MSQSLHKIVVVGGGAGGLELITFIGASLGKRKLARPILVDGTPTHIWKPLLHEVATGALNAGKDEVNYFSHGYRAGYEFGLGWMNGLDRNKKCINVAPVLDLDGKEVIGERKIRYDTLVMAVGATTDSFGTPGVEEHCLSLDSQYKAEYLRQKILSQAISVIMGNASTKKLRIGIVGGGATGVELAAQVHHTICELHQYGANLSPNEMEMTLIEAGPRLLAVTHESLSNYAKQELEKRKIAVKTNTAIKSVTEKGFILADGSLLETDIKVWTAGIKAPEWLKTLDLQLNRANRIKVTPSLQTLDDPNIFAIGDCACAPHNGDPNLCQPASAQVAHQQAEWLVKKLKAHIKGKVYPPFVYKPQGMIVSLGKGTAVGSLEGMGPKKMYVSGKSAKAIYSSLYRMHQAVIYGYARSLLIYVGDKLRKAALPQVKFH